MRFPGVTEPVQARYLADAVELIRTRHPYVAAMFWFTARDRTDSNLRENRFGLLRRDLSERPAFAILRRTLERWAEMGWPSR